MVDSAAMRSIPRNDPTGRGRDHVAAPDQSRGAAFHLHRPELVQGNSGIIAAAGIIECIRGLNRPVRSGAAGGAPSVSTPFRPRSVIPNTSPDLSPRRAARARKLPVNFLLAAQKSVQLLRGADRRSRSYRREAAPSFHRRTRPLQNFRPGYLAKLSPGSSFISAALSCRSDERCAVALAK